MSAFLRRLLDQSRHLSIKWKLTVAIVGSSALLLSLVAATVLIYESHVLRRDVLSETVTLAQIAGDNSAIPLSLHLADEARQTLAMLKSRPDITFVWLYGADGNLLTKVALDKREAAPAIKLPANTKSRFKQYELEVIHRPSIG